MTNTLDPDHAAYIRNNVSSYAATNPKETVAEIISALKGGRKFDKNIQPGIARILSHYGGDRLWQNLGDQKLLKPIGYSLLAALVAGGASQVANQQGA